MSKTFKQQLEDRLEKLQRQLDDINPLNSPATYIIEGKINEVKGIIAVYDKECIQILEAVGITQERIHEHLGYTDRKCIEFAEYINKYYRGSENIETHLWHTTEELYNEYTAQETRRETSTEDSSSSK